MDNYVSGNMILFVGAFECIAVGFYYGNPLGKVDLCNLSVDNLQGLKNQLNDLSSSFTLGNTWCFMLKFTSPIILLFLAIRTLLLNIGKEGGYGGYGGWTWLGWALVILVFGTIFAPCFRFWCAKEEENADEEEPLQKKHVKAEETAAVTA